MLDPKHFRKVDEILQAALTLDPAERPAYISAACSGDDSLIQEVENLLSSDEENWELIGTPAFEMVAPLLAREDEPELGAGELIAQYRIISLLGAGGMGQVYLAEDKKLGRRVALKLLTQSYTRDESRLHRFQQEARAASALNHPNILTIHELGEVEARLFIATEFVEGETLRERLRRGRLNANEAVEIAIQIGNALAAAHKAGIVHRDIKPENIMLRPDGLIKVLDFGLAKLFDQREAPAVVDDVEVNDLSSGLFMGTLRYMSPEQAQRLPVDHRSDLFSLGVVLYEMLTGRTPFSGATAIDLLKSITTEDPPTLKGLSSDAGPGLQAIISKSLVRQKERRYQSADELLAELKAAPTTARSSAAFAASWVTTHKLPSALVLFGVLALGGVLLRYASSHRAGIPFQNIKLTKFTNFGDAWVPAIAPDGKRVAYTRIARADGLASLMLKEIDTAVERQLAPPIEGIFLAKSFSANGDQIYFRQAPRSGAPSDRMVSAAGGAIEDLPFKIPRHPVFSPDGKRIAYVNPNMREGKSSLMVANSDGSEAREVFTRREPNYYWAGMRPAWSPDGKIVVVVGQNGWEGFPRLFALDVEGRTERPITNQKWSSCQGVVWLPDMSGLMFVASEETSSILQIWYISYPSGAARRITNDTTSYATVGISSDAKTLVTTKQEKLLSIWVLPVYDAADQPGAPLSLDFENARQINTVNLSPSSNWESYERLSWTPDGRILYTSEESGNADIWSMKPDGTDRRQLTTDQHWDTCAAISPDGRFIAFMSNRDGTESIWIMDSTGNNQRRFTHKLIERTPLFSSDSQWVYFVSWESGKHATWKTSVAGGEHLPVMPDLSVVNAISPDGNLMVYLDESKVYVAPAAGGPPIKSFDQLGTNYQWAPNGKALTFLRATDTILQNLWELPLDGSPPRQLTDFKSASESVAYYAWSRDGKQLALARARRVSDVVLINDLN